MKRDIDSFKGIIDRFKEVDSNGDILMPDSFKDYHLKNKIMNKTLMREVDKLKNKLSNEEISEILIDVEISCSGGVLTFLKKEMKAEVFHRTIIGEKQRYFKSFVNFKQNNGRIENIDWIELTEYENSKIYQSEMRRD